MTDQQPTLTPKAIQTRQRIQDVAMDLFLTKGYEATTMRDIAAAAECSLGLAYRYFAGKEDLVLAFYHEMSTGMADKIMQLPPTTLADRYYEAMRDEFARLEPYREALGAMFGAAMNPDSRVAVLGEGAADIRDRSYRSFVEMVERAKDSPKSPQAEQIATLLYAAHLGLILFWLYDRTPGQRVTHQLLSFSREILGLTRRMLILPFLRDGLTRLAEIVHPVFVGE